MRTADQMKIFKDQSAQTTTSATTAVCVAYRLWQQF